MITQPDLEFESTGRLLAEITCPNCWHHFPPERLLFIARHANLIGDDVIGPAGYRRFLPTRFNVAGNAIDARGMECHQIACPRCHLEISRPLVEMPPLFISIVGAPASGKSYYLGAMAWEMRSHAPRFGLVFADGDPSANVELQRYEEALFLNANADEPVEIRKTEEHGSQLYQTISLEGQIQTFPRPFVFTVNPTAGNARCGDPLFPHRAVVLYDNAGESFLPGKDATASPVTLHLAESGVIMFMFDPTQDPRFRQRCHSDDPQLRYGMRPGTTGASLLRQEVILNEMAARVRRYKGFSHSERHKKPLVVILAKADIWLSLIGESLETEPWASGVPTMLDLARITRTSSKCRELLQGLCPEVVGAAEGFSQRVIYLPVSSLGTSPELVERGETRFYGIRPRNIKPRWVSAPILWSLSQNTPGLIETFR